MCDVSDIRNHPHTKGCRKNERMNLILAIDPGSEQSAFVLLGSQIQDVGKIPNEDFLKRAVEIVCLHPEAHVVCEKIESYGMPVGREVFDTIFFTGRLTELLKFFKTTVNFVPRKEVKLSLCGQTRAKDANIIQALKDRFGDKPTKAKPNLFYGAFKLKADEWQALALAVVVQDQLRESG